MVGVDINPQKNYPFPFVQADAREFIWRQDWKWREFDAIHASPPCQAYTRKSSTWGRARVNEITHPDLVGITREALIATGLPYVIENVVGAPIRGELMLCGSMFGLQIQKHRLFEANWGLPLAPAECYHVGLYNPWQGAGRSAEKFRLAQDTPWLPSSGGASRKAGYTGDLSNAIPPAYTEFIGRALIERIGALAL